MRTAQGQKKLAKVLSGVQDLSKLSSRDTTGELTKQYDSARVIFLWQTSGWKIIMKIVNC